jgi:hypothetical protein
MINLFLQHSVNQTIVGRSINTSVFFFHIQKNYLTDEKKIKNYYVDPSNKRLEYTEVT